METSALTAGSETGREASGGRAPVLDVLEEHTEWLTRFGELSWDHQSYYAGRFGAAAKALYYHNKWLGMVAVSPMVLSEALLPAARRMFHVSQRFPIADAHYAAGYALLAKLTGRKVYLDRAAHFLQILESTRCPGHERHGWGYPFDWVTRTGVMKTDTPLITTTPYVYEAFAAMHALNRNPHWLDVMRSTAEHAFRDIPDRVIGPDEAAAGYNPLDREGCVVNSSAYRAFLLTEASGRFGRLDYAEAARLNLNFVLRSQRPDGSWFYAMDGEREFIDHFHTCFVMKALAKIERLTGDAGCSRAIEAGARYYVEHLFDEQGLPRPFAAAPRLTVYRHELYDYAECINLGSMLRGRFPALDSKVDGTVQDLLARWVKPDGSFRSRKLVLGWDNVPMHRWAQSQAFRALAAYQVATSGAR
jgi:hypothetical protein